MLRNSVMGRPHILTCIGALVTSCSSSSSSSSSCVWCRKLNHFSWATSDKPGSSLSLLCTMAAPPASGFPRTMYLTWEELMHLFQTGMYNNKNWRYRSSKDACAKPPFNMSEDEQRTAHLPRGHFQILLPKCCRANQMICTSASRKLTELVFRPHEFE